MCRDGGHQTKCLLFRTLCMQQQGSQEQGGRHGGEIRLYGNRTLREHGRLRGNMGDSAGTGDSAEIGGTPREWEDSVGTGETLRGKGRPCGKRTTSRNGGWGRFSREQVGLSGNRWDSRERNSAGKELRMLEGTPEQTAWETSGQQSALNTCLH